MENTALIDGQRLLFGNYAVRRFCRLRGLTNDPSLILQELMGADRLDALHDVVQAGLETDYAARKQPFDLTEFEVSRFVDRMAVAADTGNSVAFAFIGTVINKPATEVPAFIEDVKRKQAEIEAEAAGQPGVAQPDPNADAGPVTSPVGKPSKPAPTVTA